jgi:YHS domain-containing protein
LSGHTGKLFSKQSELAPKDDTMPDINSLLQRIDSEFAAGDKKIKELQAEQTQAYEDRQRRLKTFEEVCNRLRDVCQPRLQALAQRFGEKVKVTPKITGSLREATFKFDSNLAHIDLRFRASTDQEVRRLVLDYELQILPILMKFVPHVQAEFPLEAVDPEAVTKWLDDRIIEFVRTFLSLHQNEYYLKGHMVVDPVAGVRFPRFAAASTLDWQGKTYYFIGEKTRREFEEKNKVGK